MKLLMLGLVLVATWWVIVFNLVIGHMKTLVLVVALVALQCGHARAQTGDAPDGTRVGTAVVSGIDDDRLSPGLRRDIEALVGRPLDAREIDALARRLEGERPDTLVAVRSVVDDGGAARVVFLVATTGTGRRDDENVNARYIVERVAIDGVADDRLSQALRDDLKAVEGSRLDRDVAEQLLRRVRDELPGYEVTRRMSRGSQRGRLTMTVVVRPGEDMRWLRFAPNRSKLIAHSDQGGSVFLDLNFGTRDVRVSPFFAIGNADDLVEEYSGVGIRVESRNLGTEELGASIEFARVDADWRRPTREALAGANTGLFAYGRRSTIAPSIAFAFSPRFSVRGGVSVTQLEGSEGRAPSVSANTFVLGLGYDRRWRNTRYRHDLAAGVDIRAASGALQSDLRYERYSSQVRYRARWGRQTVMASAMAGGITGQAPLFERFTLGDSTTLRGWDKYDIAPLGGTGMTHASVEYRNRGWALFLDAGSVWSDETAGRARVSTGVGLHRDRFFATLGFPINTRDVRAAFILGVRF